MVHHTWSRKAIDVDLCGLITNFLNANFITGERATGVGHVDADNLTELICLLASDADPSAVTAWEMQEAMVPEPAPTTISSAQQLRARATSRTTVSRWEESYVERVAFVDCRSSAEQAVSMLPAAVDKDAFVSTLGDGWSPHSGMTTHVVCYCTVGLRSAAAASALNADGRVRSWVAAVAAPAGGSVEAMASHGVAGIDGPAPRLRVHNLRGGVLAWAHAQREFVPGRMGAEDTEYTAAHKRRLHVYGKRWDLAPANYETMWHSREFRTTVCGLQQQAEQSQQNFEIGWVEDAIDDTQGEWPVDKVRSHQKGGRRVPCALIVTGNEVADAVCTAAMPEPGEQGCQPTATSATADVAWPPARRFTITVEGRAMDTGTARAVEARAAAEMIMRICRRPKQGALWRALPGMATTAKLVGGDGPLRRLMVGTAQSQSRAVRMDRRFRVACGGGKADGGDQGAAERCLFCDDAHGNDMHMHTICTDAMLQEARVTRLKRLDSMMRQMAEADPALADA
eukprot:g6132.t1